jgi:hypothetical protein
MARQSGGLPGVRGDDTPQPSRMSLRPPVCPENLKRFTDVTCSAIILTLDERTSPPADMRL